MCAHTHTPFYLHAFFIFTPTPIVSFSLYTACSYWWSLLWPGYKPAPRGFPAGVRSDGVHWGQGQADLCHLLRLQWTQCGLPWHQKWTTEEGESWNTLTDTDEQKLKSTKTLSATVDMLNIQPWQIQSTDNHFSRLPLLAHWLLCLLWCCLPVLIFNAKCLCCPDLIFVLLWFGSVRCWPVTAVSAAWWNSWRTTAP